MTTIQLGDLTSGERLLTAEEVADRAGINHRTLLSYLSDDRMRRVPQPDVRVSSRPLWLESTITAWLDARAR